jgi:phage recombination protein Bet
MANPQPKKRTEIARVNTLKPVIFEYEGQELVLSFDDVKTLVCRNQKHTPSDAEVVAFMQFCRFMRANPLVNDAYIIKYAEFDPASFVLGVYFLQGRAAEDENYDGFEEGLIVKDKEGAVVDREGAFPYPGDDVLGAWCYVYHKDRSHPTRVRVQLKNYQKMKWNDKKTAKVGQALWNEVTGNLEEMICKVARAQAHRKGFPHRIKGGGYTPEELQFRQLQKESDPNGVTDLPVSPETEARLLKELAKTIRHIDPEIQFTDEQLRTYISEIAKIQQLELVEAIQRFHQNVHSEDQFKIFRLHFVRWMENHPEDHGPKGGEPPKKPGSDDKSKDKEKTPQNGPESPQDPQAQDPQGNVPQEGEGSTEGKGGDEGSGSAEGQEGDEDREEIEKFRKKIKNASRIEQYLCYLMVKGFTLENELSLVLDLEGQGGDSFKNFIADLDAWWKELKKPDKDSALKQVRKIMESGSLFG